MIQILNVAIGLSFVYLLFSLVITALNELILSWRDHRAKFLKEGLNQMLGNHAETLKNFLGHGLIDSFSRDTNGPPSYIPSEAFVAAVLDLIKPSTAASVRTGATIAEALASNALDQNPKLKQSVTALLDEAGQDLTRFKLGLARWFDTSMDRVAGWYKRYAQQVLFVLALAIAIACNVDSAHIILSLSEDPKLRDSVVQAATEYVKADAQKNFETKNTTTPTPITELTKQAKDTLNQLNSIALPIGWGDAQWNYLFHDVGHGKQVATVPPRNSPTPPQSSSIVPTNSPASSVSPAGSLTASDPRLGNSRSEAESRGPNGAHIITALIGYLITALAASLGAPFWFDTLQRFINIRGNGRSPAEANRTRVAAVADVAKAIAPAIAAATPEVVAGGPTLIAEK